MTLVPRNRLDDLHRLLHPDADEKARRERAALDMLGRLGGVLVPFLLGAGVLWAMGTMAAGFNAGFF